MRRTWLVLSFAAALAVGFAGALVLQSLLDAYMRSVAKRTAAECVAISAALEEYRKDHSAYPPIDGQIEHLRPYLVPTYIRQLPAHAETGEPYLVVMLAGKPAVISLGKNGSVSQSGQVVAGKSW